jgi:hypothetical protein
MYKYKVFSLGAVLLLAVFTSGCCIWPFCSGGGSQSQTGFRASGEAYVQLVGGGFFFNNLTTVRGNWQFDNGAALGNTRTFQECCGPRSIPDGRVPARWTITAGVPGECIGQLTNPNVDITANDSVTAKCLIPGIIFPFIMSPGSVDLQAPPGSMEMSGSGLETAYGMPRIEYRDPYTGALVAVTTATEVRKGSSLTMTTPDLSAVYSGTYNVVVSNVLADGSFEIVGGATVDAYGRDYEYVPPPPPGECGCPPDGGYCLPCGPVSFRSAPMDRDWTKLILGNLILR